MSRNGSSLVPLRENFLSAFARLMASQKMQMNLVLDVVEYINQSMMIAKEAVVVLEDIFLNEKSAKILFAVEVFEYFVKNCNRNFHLASNCASFTESLLRLVRRQRGKFSLVEKLRSNMDNWSRIEAKVLYIIQLWYDAFMMEEQQFRHLVETYKLLRKEGILFPPRQENEKNMLAIKTSSPIFDNLAEISQQDQKKFEKKKIALGLMSSSKAIAELQILEGNPNSKNSPPRGQSQSAVYSRPVQTSAPLPPILDLTETQELIAIIRSLDYLSEETNQSYEKLKSLIENHRKPKFLGHQSEEVYQAVLREAENVVREWQGKFKENVFNQEEEYMRKVMSGMGSKSPSKGESPKTEQPPVQSKEAPKQPEDLLGNDDLLDFTPAEPKKQQSLELPKPSKQTIDLLDL